MTEDIGRVLLEFIELIEEPYLLYASIPDISEGLSGAEDVLFKLTIVVILECAIESNEDHDTSWMLVDWISDDDRGGVAVEFLFMFVMDEDGMLIELLVYMALEEDSSIVLE